MPQVAFADDGTRTSAAVAYRFGHFCNRIDLYERTRDLYEFVLTTERQILGVTQAGLPYLGRFVAGQRLNGQKIVGAEQFRAERFPAAWRLRRRIPGMPEGRSLSRREG
jgi:hypothetical protein